MRNHGWSLAAKAADEIERLNSLLRRCADTIDCLRDYVCEGGSIRMVGAVQAIDEADALLAALATPPEEK